MIDDIHTEYQSLQEIPHLIRINITHAKTPAIIPILGPCNIIVAKLGLNSTQLNSTQTKAEVKFIATSPPTHPPGTEDNSCQSQLKSISISIEAEVSLISS